MADSSESLDWMDEILQAEWESTLATREVEGALDSWESLSGSWPNPLSVTVTDPSPISLGGKLLGGSGSFLPGFPSGTTPNGKAGVSFTVPCSGVEILLKAMMGELWLVTRSVFVGVHSQKLSKALGSMSSESLASSCWALFFEGVDVDVIGVFFPLDIAVNGSHLLLMTPLEAEVSGTQPVLDDCVVFLFLGMSCLQMKMILETASLQQRGCCFY